MSSLSDIIRPGDVVAVTGFPEFYRALVPALENAVGITLADWDHMPDVHIGEAGITFPKRLDTPPVPVDEAKPDDDRVYVVYVGAEARNRAHMLNLAPVILDATGTTTARVTRSGNAAASELGVRIVDGRPLVTREPFAGQAI